MSELILMFHAHYLLNKALLYLLFSLFSSIFVGIGPNMITNSLSYLDQYLAGAVDIACCHVICWFSLAKGVIGAANKKGGLSICRDLLHLLRVKNNKQNPKATSAGPISVNPNENLLF